MSLKWLLVAVLTIAATGMYNERNICGKEGQMAIRRAMHDKGYFCDDAARGYEMMNTTVTMPKSQNISNMVMCYMISKSIATKGQMLTWPKTLISFGVNHSLIFSASETYPHYMDPPLEVHWSRLDPEERKANAKELNAVISYRHLANYWNQLRRKSKLITPMSKKQWSKWSLKLTLRMEQLLPIDSCDDLSNELIPEFITTAYAAFWEEWRDLYSFVGFHQQHVQSCPTSSYKSLMKELSYEKPTPYAGDFPFLESQFDDPQRYFLPKGIMKSLDDITFGTQPPDSAQDTEKDSKTEPPAEEL
eukprot:TRINITY_DN2145_c0_g1_i1.p1 TRINITY_DN2145_c0_g1~~TRINITY_DN2145_c0_g1_i1.p1  ORF type:complete len:326 (+),score=50.33 TRINITY_DN2145_c0_g1_i1:68-979(+)